MSKILADVLADHAETKNKKRTIQVPYPSALSGAQLLPQLFLIVGDMLRHIL
jgi:hypothetical protein